MKHTSFAIAAVVLLLAIAYMVWLTAEYNQYPDHGVSAWPARNTPELLSQ